MILHRCGVPMGGPRAVADFPEDTQVRDALADLSELDAHERDAVFAWLDGFEHHWPSRFAELGFEQERAEPSEWGRHVELCRIAIANLSRAL